jgi:hypothetical protein
VRVAELAGSMLWAAPAAALLSVVAAVWTGVDLSARPEQTAYLFGLTLLGSWGAMLPAKAVEGRKLDRSILRALYLAMGALVGLAGWALTSWLDVGPLSHWDGLNDRTLISLAGPADRPNPVGYAGYFGLLFLLGGWPWMAARDRTRRFRLLPVARAALAAGLIGLVWPFPEPWGLAAAVTTALVTQSVSPWSEPAAAYARYAARTARRGRRAA